MLSVCVSCFFFFNDTATTEIYTLSLHDALPISVRVAENGVLDLADRERGDVVGGEGLEHDAGVRPRDLEFPHVAHVDRKSTRLNSSHGYISYAVFCLKKKKTNK